MQGTARLPRKERAVGFESVPKISCLNSLAAEIVPYPAAAKGIKEEAFLLRASTPPPGLRAQPSPPAVLRAAVQALAGEGGQGGVCRAGKSHSCCCTMGRASACTLVLLSQATGEFGKPLCPKIFE